MQHLWFKSKELTRSATLHKPSESWSKDSTVSTPGEQVQALSSRRSVFLRASFVATSKPAGLLSSGTPNKPYQDMHRHKVSVKAVTLYITIPKTNTIRTQKVEKLYKVGCFVIYLYRLKMMHYLVNIMK